MIETTKEILELKNISYVALYIYSQEIVPTEEKLVFEVDTHVSSYYFSLLDSRVKRFTRVYNLDYLRDKNEQIYRNHARMYCKFVGPILGNHDGKMSRQIVLYDKL